MNIGDTTSRLSPPPIRTPMHKDGLTLTHPWERWLEWLQGEVRDSRNYLNNAVLSNDPIAPPGTLLIKNDNTNGKYYDPVYIGYGLEIVTDVDGKTYIQTTTEPSAPLGRRLMSPLGAPYTQGAI